MNDINNIVVSGHIVHTLELKKTNTGKSYVKFSIGSNHYDSKIGESVADFFDVTIFGTQAENLVQYCGKGLLVYVVGEIHQREYEGRDGEQRKTWEITANKVIYDFRKEDKEQAEEAEEVQDNDFGYKDIDFSKKEVVKFSDDDLPF